MINQFFEKLVFLIEKPAIYPFLTGLQHFQLYSSNKADIQEVIDELHMNHYINRKATHYSLGMKQKLGIALAIINQPELVILDEPMNGLDPQSNRDLRHLIMKRAKKGTTFIVSSHILSELAKIVDDVILINDGKVVLATAISELRQADNHDYILQTRNNIEAKEILVNNGYQAEIRNGQISVTLSASQGIVELLPFLINHGIAITNIYHCQTDIESILVKMLDESKSEVRA
nr:AAA family ATPase [Lentilactobacillus kisonensis]